jgi:1,4-dihydroxy-2-naphthoyl-CoA synthase
VKRYDILFHPFLRVIGIVLLNCRTDNDIIYLDFVCSGIAVLTLNRPEARNAIGVEMLSKLRASLENLQFHSSARILIIYSTVPGVFCAGADLKVRLMILCLLCSVLCPVRVPGYF